MERNFGQDSVKIHVTVMNSKWRAEEGDHRRGRRNENAFDIREILKVRVSGCASVNACSIYMSPCMSICMSICMRGTICMRMYNTTLNRTITVLTLDKLKSLPCTF